MFRKKVFINFLFVLLCFFRLYSEDLILLPEITVYLDPVVTENKITLNKEDIESLHVNDVASLLNAQGIQILEYGAYGLQKNPSLRGFTDETVRVVLDGICVNNAQYGTFDFTSLNIEDIEKIEITKGGFSENVADEGAVGGVVYITTKKSHKKNEFFSDSAIKTYFYKNAPVDSFFQNLGWNVKTGENTFLQGGLKGSFTQNHFLYKNDKGNVAAQKNSEVIDGNADLKISHYFKNGNSFTASDLFYAGNKNTPGKETETVTGNQKDFNNKLILNFEIPNCFNLFKMENSLAWLKDVRFYDSAGENSQHFIDTFKYCLKTDFFEFGKKVKFNETAGLTVDFVHLDSSNDGKHNQFSFALNETSKIEFNRHFALSIPLGIKVCGSNFAFTPKIGFSARFFDFCILINAYRMVQFPNMDDLYWEGNSYSGNPDLKPEKGIGGEITFMTENKYFPFSFTVFTNYYESKIQWATDDSGKWSPQNVSSAFYLGADLNFKKSFLDEKIILSGSAEYLFTSLLNKNNNLTYGKKIMWTPDLTASLTAVFNLKYAVLTTNVNYTGKRYTSNMNLYYLEPYVLLNLSAECTKWQKVKPYLKMDNVLNWDYEAVEDYPMPGISLTLGCKVKF